MPQESTIQEVLLNNGDTIIIARDGSKKETPDSVHKLSATGVSTIIKTEVDTFTQIRDGLFIIHSVMSIPLTSINYIIGGNLQRRVKSVHFPNL